MRRSSRCICLFYSDPRAEVSLSRPNRSHGSSVKEMNGLRKHPVLYFGGTISSPHFAYRCRARVPYPYSIYIRLPAVKSYCTFQQDNIKPSRSSSRVLGKTSAAVVGSARTLLLATSRLSHVLSWERLTAREVILFFSYTFLFSLPLSISLFSPSPTVHVRGGSILL